MNEWITQLRKGLLEFCILNLLSSSESYGYEIVQKLKSMEVLVVTESTVYPILIRLKNDGCLKVRAVSSSEGPPRRYFSLTVLGEQRVREMNEYWSLLCKAISKLQKK